MPLEPTNRSAALAGAISGLGLVVHEVWEKHHPAASVTAHNFAFLIFAVACLALPCYFLVFGQGTRSFNPAWLREPSERARYLVVVKRMLCWFLAAGATLSLTSLLTQ